MLDELAETGYTELIGRLGLYAYGSRRVKAELARRGLVMLGALFRWP